LKRGFEYFEVDMIDPLDTEINVDEIMERIREEVKRRKKLPEQETYQKAEQLPTNPSTIKGNMEEGIKRL
jgi:hypothetical protein